MSDPFRRNKPSGPLSRFVRTNKEGAYQGQTGLEILFRQAMPLVLVRTDPRSRCVCQSQGKTGDSRCSRCFGTGAVVLSLDRFSGYIDHSKPGAAAPTTPQGWEYADIKKVFSGRWVYPTQGDLILEVGWNVPNNLVYSQGIIQTVDNVYQVKQVNHAGFEEISYTVIFTIFANTRRMDLEDLILFSPTLPPYRNCQVPT